MTTETLCVLTEVPPIYADLNCRIKKFEMVNYFSTVSINNVDV